MTEDNAIFEEYEQARERLACAIGSFVLGFQFLENMLDWALCKFEGLKDNQRRAFLDNQENQNLGVRLKLLESNVESAEKMSDEVRSTLKDVIAAARELKGLRNTWVHNYWGGWSPMEDRFFSASLSSASKGKPFDHISEALIREATEKCFPLASQLSKALKRHDKEKTEAASR